MGRVLDFEYYEKDKLCTKVHVDYAKQTVDVKNFTDDIVAQAFGKQVVTIDSIDEFFRDRVFQETRADIKELLEMLGLRCYDAEAIARKTHGMLINDLCWIRFDNEDLNYQDIANMRHW